MTTSSAKTFTPKELIEHIPETTDPFWHNVAVEHMNKLTTAHPSPKTAADWLTLVESGMKAPSDHMRLSTLVTTLCALRG